MTREQAAQAAEVLKAYRNRLTNAVSNQLDGDIQAFDMAIQALQAQAEQVKIKQIRRKLKPLADGEMCPICGSDSSHLCYVSKDDEVWAECLRCGSRVLIKESKIAFYKYIAENMNPNEYQKYYNQYYHTTDEKVGGRE